ncbi:DUF1330 domain-containing protein [Burkholderia pyrrocinia]|uniref:DUF1330 domain-containing protein n=1 Tax=Burkholderia pyrrocinia TaxID=60550 RepID=UPI0037DD4BC4
MRIERAARDRSGLPQAALTAARPEVREGVWRGDLIAIAFPDLDTARAWYESDAYRQIQPLRARRASGPLILIDGVDERHKATDIPR